MTDKYEAKAEPIKALLNSLAIGSIGDGECPTCGDPIGAFKDKLSLSEWRISGMCQSCQDSVFDSPPLD